SRHTQREAPAPLQLIVPDVANAQLGTFPIVMIPTIAVTSSILLHGLSLRLLCLSIGKRLNPGTQPRAQTRGSRPQGPGSREGPLTRLAGAGFAPARKAPEQDRCRA